MGLLDFLSKDGRKASALKKNVARALNKHMQSMDRMRALEALAEDNSPEATYGLLRRYSYVYDKTIEDEQEKHWVEETLVAKGKQILPMLRKYLTDAESIAWPLRILGQVASAEEIEEALAALCRENEPGYARDPSKKIQMLRYIHEHDASGAQGTLDVLVPYLADMDEGVRFAVVNCLLEKKDERAAAPLLEHFLKPEEESGRIRIRIAEGFADLGWNVPKAQVEAVSRLLASQFSIDKSGKISRRTVG